MFIFATRKQFLSTVFPQFWDPHFMSSQRPGTPPTPAEQQMLKIYARRKRQEIECKNTCTDPETKIQVIDLVASSSEEEEEEEPTKINPKRRRLVYDESVKPTRKRKKQETSSAAATTNQLSLSDCVKTLRHHADLFDILTAVRSSDDESYKGNAEGTRKAARLLEKEWPTSQTFTHASIQNFMRKTKYFGKTSCWTVQELIAQDSIHSTRVEDELTACIHDRSRILEGDTQKLAFYRRKGYAKAFGFDTLPNCLCGIKVVRRVGKTPGRKSFQKPYYCCKNHKFLSGGRTSGCKFWRLAPPKS